MGDFQPRDSYKKETVSGIPTNIGVLKNFAIFAGKHLCWSLFLKKDSNTGGFPVNIAKFSRTASFTEQLQWLLLCLKEYGY